MASRTWAKAGCRSGTRPGTGRSERKNDAAARDVAERWEQFTNYLCLSLSQELGATVTVARPRNQPTPARLEDLIRDLESHGELRSTVRIPDAAGPLTIRSNLRSRQTFLSVAVDAPREGRAKGRFNWLIRQLKQAPDELLIETTFANARTTTAVKLGEVRDDPTPAFYTADPKREPRTFLLTMSKPMGRKRGRAEGSFVRETGSQTVAFYRDIVQNLKPWQPTAPKLHTEPQLPEPIEPVETVLVPAWGPDVAPGIEDG